MKTSELTGPALDWAVADCEGHDFPSADAVCGIFNPSINWSQGGPIIEREGIEIRKGNPLYFPQGNDLGAYYEPLWLAGKMHGPAPLIAAMRCYVASKLGDTVDIPQEIFSC